MPTAQYEYSAGWVNQSSTGRRVAIHRYGTQSSSPGSYTPCDITKLSVIDSNNGDPPTVSVDGLISSHYSVLVSGDTTTWDHLNQTTSFTPLVVYDDMEDPLEMAVFYHDTYDFTGARWFSPYYETGPWQEYYTKRHWLAINGVEVNPLYGLWTRTRIGDSNVLISDTQTGVNSGPPWYVMHGKFLIAPVGGMSSSSHPQWVEEFWPDPYPIYGWFTHKANAYAAGPNYNIPLFTEFFENICIDANGVLDTNKIRRF